MEQLIALPVTQIANQVDLPFAVREEFRLDLIYIKARHGARRGGFLRASGFGTEKKTIEGLS